MTDFLSTIPAGLWLLVAIVILVCGGVVLYALRAKGDVLAELTHGATSFKLHAKERPPTTNGERSESRKGTKNGRTPGKY